jgi:hypothetical protein
MLGLPYHEPRNDKPNRNTSPSRKHIAYHQAGDDNINERMSGVRRSRTHQKSEVDVKPIHWPANQAKAISAHPRFQFDAFGHRAKSSSTSRLVAGAAGFRSIPGKYATEDSLPGT